MSTPQPYVFPGVVSSNGDPVTILGHFVHHVVFSPQKHVSSSVQSNLPSDGVNIVVVPNNQLEDWIREIQTQSSSTENRWLNRNQVAQISSNEVPNGQSNQVLFANGSSVSWI